MGPSLNMDVHVPQYISAIPNIICCDVHHQSGTYIVGAVDYTCQHITKHTPYALVKW